MDTPRSRAALLLPATFFRPSELIEHGFSRDAISRMVRARQLVRLRNGRYVRAETPLVLVQAGRLGGRLDCLSLLQLLGIFVHTCDRLHLQIDKGASRLPPRQAAVVAHWRETARDRSSLTADLTEALAQSFRCQPMRDAVATLDSAWHHGLIDHAGVTAVFDLLPRRYRRLRGLLDRRSESGAETIMRLMLRSLGCSVEVQPRITGVGRVDFVVDGWLIVECDSKAHHEGWEAQRRDRRRDLAAAAQGYTTIRPIAEDILYRREEMLGYLRAVLATANRTVVLQNSFDPVASTLMQV